MTTNIGIIPLETDDDELSDEQLQRLGIIEYPDEPEWVGNRRTHGLEVTDGMIHRFLLRYMESLGEHNPVNQIRGNTWEGVFIDEVSPATLSLTITSLSPVTQINIPIGSQWTVATQTTNTEPELNFDEPTLENLREMTRRLSEGGTNEG